MKEIIVSNSTGTGDIRQTEDVKKPSPTPVAVIALDAIMEKLLTHYWPQTIKIVGYFNFLNALRKREKVLLNLWQNCSS